MVGTASSIGIWDETEQKSYWSGFGFTWCTAQVLLDKNSSESSGTCASPFAKGWYTGVDNLQISKSTTIENAKGGAKADTLIGNDVTMNLPVMPAMTISLEVEETILLFTAVRSKLYDHQQRWRVLYYYG